MGKVVRQASEPQFIGVARAFLCSIASAIATWTLPWHGLWQGCGVLCGPPDIVDDFCLCLLFEGGVAFAWEHGPSCWWCHQFEHEGCPPSLGCSLLPLLLARWARPGSTQRATRGPLGCHCWWRDNSTPKLRRRVLWCWQPPQLYIS